MCENEHLVKALTNGMIFKSKIALVEENLFGFTFLKAARPKPFGYCAPVNNICLQFKDVLVY